MITDFLMITDINDIQRLIIIDLIDTSKLSLTSAPRFKLDHPKGRQLFVQSKVVTVIIHLMTKSVILKMTSMHKLICDLKSQINFLCIEAIFQPRSEIVFLPAQG